MKAEPRSREQWQELVEQLSALPPDEAEPIWFGEAEEALVARDTYGLGVCLQHSQSARQLVSDILCGKVHRWRLDIIQNFIGRPPKAETIVDGLFIGDQIELSGGKQEAGVADAQQRWAKSRSGIMRGIAVYRRSNPGSPRKPRKPPKLRKPRKK